MTSLAETVRAYAAGFSFPQPRTSVVARTIREQDSMLLPHDPVGRNKSTLCVPPNFTNLMVGMAAADPITNAAALIRAYRAARYQTPLAEILGEVEPSVPILGTGSLGPALDNLIDVLAHPSEEERAVRRAFTGSLRVTLVVGEALEVVVQDIATQRRVHYDAKSNSTPAGGKTFRFQGRDRQVVPLRRVATLEFAHFELAAELWADSLKHGAVYTPSLSDSSDDEPETEGAGSPGREPTPSDCQPSTHATDDSGTPSKTSGLDNRRCNSGVCVSSSGKSVRAGAATTNRRRHHALASHHHASA